MSAVPITLWWLTACALTIVGPGPVAFAWLVSGFVMVWNCVLTDPVTGGSTAEPDSASAPTAQKETLRLSED